MDDSMNDEDFPNNSDPFATSIFRYEKAHSRSIVGVWSFRFGGHIGVVTVGHDSSKLWVLMEHADRVNVTVEESMVLAAWQCAVQHAEVSRDGQYAVITGINSIVHEIVLTNTVDYVFGDFGYMEAVHCTLRPDCDGFATVAYSGTINEVGKSNQKITRKEPYHNGKTICCMKYSRDGTYLALGHLNGGIEMLATSTFKQFHKYEVHSMKIRRIEFLPGNTQFLSACEDRLIKLNTLVDFSEPDATRSTKAIRVFSAHNGPVTGLTIDEKSGGTRFASSSATSQIFIWHIEMTTPVIAVANEHNSTICGLSFSPTGRHLISGGDDGTLQVYNINGSGEMSPVYYEEDYVEDEVTAAAEEEKTTTSQVNANLNISDSDDEEDQENFEPEGHESPTIQYEEYRPYGEPRTPPEEDEEDLGDYVYETGNAQ